MFKNDTNRAETTIKTVKVPHMFSQLLTLSHDFLKISSFNPHATLQMHVLLVNCRKSSLYFDRTVLSHAGTVTLISFSGVPV